MARTQSILKLGADFSMRKIIHIDMDAFFASVEQRDQVELRGRPVIVGGAPGRRGVVAAASYEARKFGIHSAMASSQAVKLCPQAVFVKPNFPAYKAVSEQIHTIFKQYTDVIEPLSIDEAFLDVSGQLHCQGAASLMAEAIRKEIYAVTQLTASAGVSYNKFLAKIASDMNKPNGMYIIRPEQGESFVAQLPVGKFHGVGKATEAKMQRLGIHTGADLRSHSLEWLSARLGKSAEYYYYISRGIDQRPVRTHRKRKSLGAETTFQQDLREPADMLVSLQQRLEKVLAQVKQKQLLAKTITIKVKFSDFTQVTRSHSFEYACQDEAQFSRYLLPLLQSTSAGRLAGQKAVRLLGVTLSGFEREQHSDTAVQLDLF